MFSAKRVLRYLQGSLFGLVDLRRDLSRSPQNQGDKVIRRVSIRNYRRFRTLDLDLSQGMNVLVGDNDTGKSTLIEAINLALTGKLHGRLLVQELSPYLINSEATRDYIQALRGNPRHVPPPTITIELILDGEDAEILRGTNNLANEDACGVKIEARLSDEYYEEYRNFVSRPADVTLVPTEYYRVEWLGFSGNPITARSVPTSSSIIDASTIKLQAGVDHHLQQIVRTYLDAHERAELSREYRCAREEFSEKPSIKAINERLGTEDNGIADRRLSLAIDISQRYTWESSLTAHLDNLPFHLLGQGDQNVLKTLLAIGHRTEGAHVVLIEEPENHLSFSSLRRLISKIEACCKGKQVIVATHSAFVLNKLGLASLVLLGDGAPTRLASLPPQTVDYFKKLAGFDTLRLVLSKGAVLVEGPSDELVVQRAYRDTKGRLPIEDGIDVISVGLSHKRFLDIAICLERRVWVVTDNDGRSRAEVEARFAQYLGRESRRYISIHTGDDPDCRTLEPQIVAVNDLETLNAVFESRHTSKAEVLAAMLADKTGAALAIFESDTKITMPKYIRDVFAI